MTEKPIEPLSTEVSPKVDWYIKACEEAAKRLAEEAERLFYTAQKGSTLDKIWKGEYK